MSARDTGIIGWPVAQSLSPVIHAYWRAKHAITGDYRLFPIDPAHFAEQLKTVKTRSVRGFNVTVPHKETIIPFLDTVDDAARHIGAVNTVVRDGATWRGTNTDAYGFITHLKEQVGDLQPYIDKVVVLGAGGAARAVIVALQEAGARQMVITNRTKPTADMLAAEFGVKAAAWEEKENQLQAAGLLVNTTVLGMKGKPPLEIDIKNLPPAAAVYDIVYAPLETELLKKAKATGRRPVDGLGMLLYQAQRAFQEWHGVLPAVDDGLRTAVLAEIKKRGNP